MQEIWKDIPGFEGKYRVSTLGRIKSLPRLRKSSYGSVSKLRGRYLIPAKVGKGYQSVGLCKNSKVKQVYVHRVVWEAFKGTIPNRVEVNHKDGNKKNNRLDNLELLSHKENIAHGIKTGLIRHMSAGNVPNVKLSADQAEEIRRRIRAGEIQAQLAKKFKVSKQTITFIKQNKIWKQ